MLEENYLEVNIISLILFNGDASFFLIKWSVDIHFIYKYTLLIYLDNGYSIYLYILIISLLSEVQLFILQVLI